MNAFDATTAPHAAQPQVSAGPSDDAADLSRGSLGSLMKGVVSSIAHHADRRLGARGLTHAQWALLMKLRDGGPATVAGLARGCQVDAGAMTRLLDRLEKKHLCRRLRSLVDRRVVRIELTADGAAAAAQVCGMAAEVLNAHLADFTHAEWQALNGYLRRMVMAGDAMRSRNDISLDPPRFDTRWLDNQ